MACDKSATRLLQAISKAIRSMSTTDAYGASTCHAPRGGWSWPAFSGHRTHLGQLRRTTEATPLLAPGLKGKFLTCPRCGGEARSPIALGYWRCESVTDFYHPDMPYNRGRRVCGTEYQEGGQGAMPLSLLAPDAYRRP